MMVKKRTEHRAFWGKVSKFCPLFIRQRGGDTVTDIESGCRTDPVHAFWVAQWFIIRGFKI